MLYIILFTLRHINNYSKRMANIYGHVIYNIYWHLAIGLLLQNEMVRIYMKYVVIGYNLVL